MTPTTYIDGVPVCWSSILGQYVVREPLTPRYALNTILGWSFALGSVIASLFCVVGGIGAVVDLIGSLAR